MYKLLLFFSFFLISLPHFGQYKSLSLEEIVLSRKFIEKRVWGMHHLNSGKHFSRIEQDEKGLLIASYNYSDGHRHEIIFRSDWLDDPIAFTSYLLSEDETRILLATATERIYRRSSRSHYYIWDREQRTLTRLAEGAKQMEASFSPDGRKVAFIQENDLFYKDFTNGETTRITNDGRKNFIINGATDWVYEEEFKFTRAYDWSADSRMIAFMKFDESNVREFSMTLYHNRLYPYEYKFKYPKAGEDNSLVSLYVFQLDNLQIKKLDVNLPEDHYFPRMKWTNDPDLLSIQRMNRHQNRLDFILADIAVGSVQTIFTETNPYFIRVHDNLTFLPDNKHFIWTSEKDGYNHIYLYDLGGRKITQVTKGRWEVTNYLGFDEQNNQIYFQSTEVSPLERHIYSIGLNGWNKKQLTHESGTWRADFSGDFSYVILNYSNRNAPLTISVHDRNMIKIRVLEDNAELKRNFDKYGLVDKELFSFTTSEDVTLNGWLMKPAGLDTNRMYPLLMFVYGGPGSQTALDAWLTRHDMWFQYLTQQGYVIASIDNRGTGGRGEEFLKQIYLKLGQKETRDQIEAAKYLGSYPYIDRERIGIFGWSYGGYLSSLALFKGNQVFSTAIAVAPVTHWRFYDTIYTERYMRTPGENPEGYHKGSPVTYAHQLEGNYLLIHGTADDNVHFQNAVELMDALIRNNKQYEQFTYPDGNHGIGGGQVRLHLYRLMTGFLERNL